MAPLDGLPGHSLACSGSCPGGLGAARPPCLVSRPLRRAAPVPGRLQSHAHPRTLPLRGLVPGALLTQRRGTKSAL